MSQILFAQAASVSPPGIAEQLFYLSTSKLALILIFGGAFLTAIVSVIAGVIQNILKTRSRERTRQEVAAYVAEGTMTADEGERLLAASSKNKRKCE